MPEPRLVHHQANTSRTSASQVDNSPTTHLGSCLPGGASHKAHTLDLFITQIFQQIEVSWEKISCMNLHNDTVLASTGPALPWEVAKATLGVEGGKRSLITQKASSHKESPNLQLKELGFSSVQSLSHVQLFATPWTAACQASLSITNSLFTQTHVHWVSDAIQPSRPLLSSSPPAFNLSQHQGLFKWVSSLYQVANVFGVSA